MLNYYNFGKYEGKKNREQKETCSREPLQSSEVHIRPEDRELDTENYCYYVL